MEQALLTIAYLVSGVLFIMSLRGLSSQETAQQGNRNGIAGMLIALVATAMVGYINAYAVLIIMLLIGAAIGIQLARKVAMTAMPELVALLHSFVGAAAVLVGFATYLGARKHNGLFHSEIAIDVIIGSITFTGSVVAYLKLKGSVSGSPLLLPGRHAANLAMLVSCIVLTYLFAVASGTGGTAWLVVATVVSGIMGVHLVMAIGGADMPVVVSMLNSYSGWTAAAAGFMLGNDLLIITGALVGSSGAILSYIMCKAMNRSIWSVIFGGFGTGPSKAPPRPVVEGEGPAVIETDIDQCVAELRRAKRIIVVPGYGMAVARAQHAVWELTQLLQKNGADIHFGIHPVAGRLPGHMNVLLAEANVPYDIVLEMDEINSDFPQTDVCLVIGANDIVNPGAQTDESSPIYGMPVLEAWKSKRTVIFKRSRRTGYAGVDNPLFYDDKTRMLFGDARDSMDALVGALKA